jgi:hypothetical protein
MRIYSSVHRKHKKNMNKEEEKEREKSFHSKLSSPSKLCILDAGRKEEEEREREGEKKDIDQIIKYCA